MSSITVLGKQFQVYILPMESSSCHMKSNHDYYTWEYSIVGLNNTDQQEKKGLFNFFFLASDFAIEDLNEEIL